MGARKVYLEFSDGETTDLEVDGDTTILAGALEQGVNLAHQCLSGSCTSCAGRLVEGDTEPVIGRGSSLLPSEYLAGHRLLCSTYARSDVRFELPYPSSLVYGPQPQIYLARIRELRRLSATAMELTLELPASVDLDFVPGQYARLRVPGTTEWRSYSMLTTPDDRPALGFLVKLLPGGAMSDFLRGGPPVGSEMEVEGPFGAFLLKPEAPAYVLIAGGTGLAPLLSMLDTLRARRGPKPAVTLCFACETIDDLFYEEELELRSFWMPRLDARIAVTSPPDDYAGTVGNPVSLIEDRDFGEGAEAYVCGPPGMIAAAISRLTAIGLPSSDIHTERFVASEL